MRSRRTTGRTAAAASADPRRSLCRLPPPSVPDRVPARTGRGEPVSTSTARTESRFDSAPFPFPGHVDGRLPLNAATTPSTPKKENPCAHPYAAPSRH